MSKNAELDLIPALLVGLCVHGADARHYQGQRKHHGSQTNWFGRGGWAGAWTGAWLDSHRRPDNTNHIGLSFLPSTDSPSTLWRGNLVDQLQLVQRTVDEIQARGGFFLLMCEAELSRAGQFVDAALFLYQIDKG